MADHHSILVTEVPFAVRDPEEFVTAISPYASPIHSEGAAGLLFDRDARGRFWLGGYDTGFPTFYRPNSDEEVDLLRRIQAYLAAGECAILMKVGLEKLRYVTGTVYAISRARIQVRTLDEAAAELRRSLTGDKLRRTWAVVTFSQRDLAREVETGFEDRLAALRRALDFVSDQLDEDAVVSEDLDEGELEDLIEDANEHGPDSAEVAERWEQAA